ncbi:MAG: hypothetical protein AB1442_13400, partial [Nitrospirota bacterium]
IIDADYPDASGIAAVCKKHSIPFAAVTCSPWNIGVKLRELDPEYLYVSPENDKIFFSVLSEILSGSRQAKGRLPYSSLSLPPEFDIPLTDM